MSELTDSQIKAIFIDLDTRFNVVMLYGLTHGMRIQIYTSVREILFSQLIYFWKGYTLEWSPSPCGLLVYTVCFFPC